MKREIIKDLLKWKESSNRKPLIVHGARQVGKTYIIKQFGKENYNNLFECDLLIIDDLGTELTNTFTVSELFMILNTRLLNKKKTIISTNFSLGKLAETYTERISSRIFDKFTLVKFVGKDLRWESKFD